MDNEQENITKKATSPQQILNTANQHIKLEQYENLFDPQYSIDQSSNTDASKYKWTDGVTSEIITQEFNPNQQHPFDNMYENNDNNQIPFHYGENPSPQHQQQQNNNVGMEQFNFSQHRNSLPLLHNADMFTPSSTNMLTSANMQTIPTSIVSPYNRRYTEGSIPSSTATTTTKKSRKQKASSVSLSSKEDDDEESKRKHFLERNRQAALKCRQRKKQWLANLQHRVEFLSTDNEQLQSQATMLREEVINLKTLLLAHRDCAVFNANTASTGNSMFSFNLPAPSDNNKHWSNKPLANNTDKSQENAKR
ncbi:hypothetical protein INT46_005711 [Mucor plumbeus]|uniref:BZIP domain-containing protein n=1 Tax=Mucor plumbeus TaxID=97098 RepID=A0A8H7QFV8_9FUNG|nr:hypothetical protein INT46_005711 [Mucor plumbeus]